MKIERKICDWITGKKNLLFLVIVSLLAFMVRADVRKFLSFDARFYLIPWFYDIKRNGGFQGLSVQVGNYNLLYQTVIAMMTYLPVGDNELLVVYVYKMISCAFDFILAIGGAEFVVTLKKKERFGTLYNVVYTVILFTTTVIANSAVWGQCDSIYTSFCILCLLCLYREKFVKAFIYLGIAFALKLQTVFLLPFLVTYYFYKKNFSILNFGVSLAVFWMTGLPAFLEGRSLWAPFQIYLSQSDEYQEMYLGVCSFWRFFAQDYGRFKNLAVTTTLVLCGLMLYLVLTGKKKINTSEEFLNTAAWFVWTCVFFLPAMHERYTYMQDILLILLAFLDRKYIKYAVICEVISLMSYGEFLFDVAGVGVQESLLIFFAWAHFTVTICKGASGSDGVKI